MTSSTITPEVQEAMQAFQSALLAESLTTAGLTYDSAARTHAMQQLSEARQSLVSLIRSQTIEECAKVVENCGARYRLDSDHHETLNYAASRIRAQGER